MSEPRIFEVPVLYEKSRYFRVIHADGAYGGVSPSGDLHIGLYNERHPLPTQSTLKFETDSSGNQSLAEVVTNKSDGVFREVEVDVIIDLPTAVGLYVWLEGKMSELADLVELPKAELDSMLESARTRRST